MQSLLHWIVTQCAAWSELLVRSHSIFCTDFTSFHILSFSLAVFCFVLSHCLSHCFCSHSLWFGTTLVHEFHIFLAILKRGAMWFRQDKECMDQCLLWGRCVKTIYRMGKLYFVFLDLWKAYMYNWSMVYVVVRRAYEVKGKLLKAVHCYYVDCMACILVK